MFFCCFKHKQYAIPCTAQTLILIWPGPPTLVVHLSMTLADISLTLKIISINTFNIMLTKFYKRRSNDYSSKCCGHNFFSKTVLI